MSNSIINGLDLLNPLSTKSGEGLVRALFKTLEFESMEQLFKAILYGYKAKVVILSPP